MKDRELLELAAKAFGFSDIDFLSFDCGGYANVYDSKGRHACWNPLADDGDALRLAVRLHIDTRLNNGAAEAIWIDDAISETHSVEVPCDEAFEGWPAKYAATRRAIVLAAAEIGSLT